MPKRGRETTDVGTREPGEVKAHRTNARYKTTPLGEEVLRSPGTSDEMNQLLIVLQTESTSEEVLSVFQNSVESCLGWGYHDTADLHKKVTLQLPALMDRAESCGWIGRV